MNGYQRIQAALNNEKPDRVPVMLHNFMVAAREAGYTMKQFREQPRVMADSFIKSVETYHFDGILVDVDTVTLAGACGVPVDLPLEDPARSHLGCLNDMSRVNQLKVPDLSTYRYAVNWLEAVRLIKEYFKDDIYVRGNCDQSPFSLASMIRGTQNWMMDFYTANEADVFTLLEYCTQVTNQFISLMSETGADMVSNGDSPAGPDMVPPEFYVKYALPYQKQVVDHAHSLNLPYVLHICGNTESILDHMIETGSDGLELDYKTDSLVTYEKLHDRLCFFGNIDPSGVLALGSTNEVVEKTNELLSVFQSTNRFVLNSGCALPPATPPKNLKAFIQTARDFVI